MRLPGIKQSSYYTSPANNILSCYIFNLLILSIDLSIKFVIADQHNTTLDTNTNGKLNNFLIYIYIYLP